MKNSDSGTGFLSGYMGEFLGMSRTQQNSSGLFGFNMDQQIESSNLSRPQNYPGQSSTNLRPILPKGVSSISEKERTTLVNTIISDDDDDMSDGNGENSCGGKGQKGCSSWQRMKWTDNVIKLLIKVVGCVADDGTLESSEGLKRKSSHLHKKGKWKTVSKMMLSKGCYVSPQQCEDKFNDLNKRYKKLNDILGKGASCKVVENPALMDSMPHLSEKTKGIVKKLLCSKHLFYKEMCSYHNGQEMPNCHDLEKCVAPECEAIQAKNSDESDDHSESEDDENSSGDEYRIEENLRVRSSRQEQFQVEMDKVFNDPTKSKWERKEWVKNRMVKLKEESIEIEFEAFELEKQKIKWKRFCRKKEMELETSRLEKQELILENERRSMQLKEKELQVKFNKKPIAL